MKAMKAMLAMKGNGYDYVIIMIVFVFFLLPSLIICYNLYYEENNIETFPEKCMDRVLPNEITTEWFFTPQGSLFLVGTVFLIVIFILKDLRSNKDLEKLKIYKKRL